MSPKKLHTNNFSEESLLHKESDDSAPFFISFYLAGHIIALKPKIFFPQRGRLDAIFGVKFP